jgi:predicted PurR-regulated permease PerM
MKETTYRKPLELLQLVVLISILLYFGSTFFIPFSFSLLISFILYPVCNWFEKKGINRAFAILIPMVILTLLFIGILLLLLFQIKLISNEWAAINLKITETTLEMAAYIEDNFGVNSANQLAYINKSLSNLSVFPIVKSVAFSFFETAINAILFPLLSALILYYRSLLVKVVYQLFPSNETESIHEILIKTIHEYYNFIKGMMMVYLIVGLLNSIGLLLIGVPHAFLFGFIASILTFIPYVGIIISSILPIVVSWVTFNSIWYPLGVIVVFTIVQILEAYLIFPLAVGNRLKINTLVILVVIFLGELFWGTAGMILFIPYTSILKLIADRSKKLKALSLLLGEGKLQ